jgi:hypothetical protein
MAYLFLTGRFSFIEPRRREGHEGRERRRCCSFFPLLAESWFNLSDATGFGMTGPFLLFFNLKSKIG